MWGGKAHCREAGFCRGEAMFLINKHKLFGKSGTVRAGVKCDSV